MEKIRRRDVIRLVGVGAMVGGGTAVLGGAALAETGPGNPHALSAESAFGVVGTVLSSDADHIQVRSGSEMLRATPAPGARLYSGVSGVVTSPSQFLVGDRVFVDGAKRDGDVIEATRIGSVYELVSFKVDSLDTSGGVASTSIGILDLMGSLPDIRRVTHSLKAHETQRGLLWTDPRTGEKFLMLAERDTLPA